MSWVKEALQGGQEDKRRAAEQQRAKELARLAGLSDQERAKEETKAQAERERQDEVARLKRLLDERSARQLLEEIRAELGGEIMFRDSSDTELSEGYTDNWAAYALTKVGVGHPTDHEDGGYEDTYHSTTLGDLPTTRSRGYVPYQKYKETPVSVTQAVVAANHCFYVSKGPQPIEFHASLKGLMYSIKVYDIYTRGGKWGEIPRLLRGLPLIPGLISQRVVSDLPLLANGRVDIDSIGIISRYPDGDKKIDLTDNPQADSLGIRQLLAEGLRGMA